MLRQGSILRGCCMKNLVFTFTFLAGLFASSAHAAFISVGGMNIDDYKFADSVLLVSGSAPKDASNAEGFDFDQFITIDLDDVLSVGFTDNVLFNGSGFDILVFELAGIVENSSLSLLFGGSEVSGTFLSTDRSLGTQFQVNIFGFDLSDFGIGIGEYLLDPLFLSPINNNPDIAAIAAINSITSEQYKVPTPTTASMMLFLLVAIAFRAKRRFS